MKINISVKPSSKHPGVEVQSDGSLRVAVNAPAQDGKANQAVIAAVAKHLGIPKSRIKLIRGLKGRKKVIEVAETS